MAAEGRRKQAPGRTGRTLGAPPRPETSPLSPLPSPSHRPGEGNAVEAVVLLGCFVRIGNGVETNPTSTIASAKSPSPGRWEGDGRGDRGEVSGGGKPQRPPPPKPAPKSPDRSGPAPPHPPRGRTCGRSGTSPRPAAACRPR